MALASGCRLTMAAAALILAASCSVPAAEPPLNEQLVDGQTLYVTDGDTVRLASGECVRLAGVDAPELPPRARCDREVRLALEAKARLLELTREADRVTLRHPVDEPRDADHYGRLLRDLHIDGVDAGEILVAEGLAQVWRGRKAEWCEGAPN